MPPFYGVAWREWHRNATIALPIPLHLIARALRALWLFLRFGGVSVDMDPRAAYAQGVKVGRQRAAKSFDKGFQIGVNYTVRGQKLCAECVPGDCRWPECHYADREEDPASPFRDPLR